MENQIQEAQGNAVQVVPCDNGETEARYFIAPAPMDCPVEQFTRALERREANRKALVNWISRNLVEGVDFGKIHVMGKDRCDYARRGMANECPNPRHWSKPSLFKPGSEKITGMLGLIPRFPNLKEYEKAVLRGERIEVIILKCELHTAGGFIVAEGTGARVLAQDNGDINKALKMAVKSAHIDATLRVAGLSELFTQDLETMFEEKPEEPASHPREADTDSASGGHIDTQPVEPNPTDENSNRRITSDLYRRIISLSKEKEMGADIRKWCIDTYGVVPEHLRVKEAIHLIGELTRL